MAPAVVSALPSRLVPELIVIAALLTITVPFIVVPAARFTAPSIFQNTLQASALFERIMREPALLENAPCILMIKTAFALPCAFKVSVPFNVEFPEMEYTPAFKLCPPPKEGAGKNVATVL